MNNKIDEEEMIKFSRIYTLNTKIEIAMNNIKLNHLVDNKTKENFIRIFQSVLKCFGVF